MMGHSEVIEKVKDSRSNADLTMKLPDEILTAILEECLLLEKNIETKSHPVVRFNILDDVENLSYAAFQGHNFPSSNLRDTHWFKSDVAIAGGICGGDQVSHSFDYSALRVCQRWNNLGRGLLLLRPNAFIEVIVSEGSRFVSKLTRFGLKVWPLQPESRMNVTTPAIRIQIQNRIDLLQGGGGGGGGVKFTKGWQPNQSRYLLDLNDVNEFGRFLTVMTGAKEGWCKGKCLQIEILKDRVPGFCRLDNAFEKMFRDPFLANLSDSIDQIHVAPHLSSHDELLSRLEKVKAEVIWYRKTHQRDLLNPMKALSRLVGQYETAAKENRTRDAETTLRRILELSTTVLVSKFPEFRENSGESDAREHNEKCFFFDVLRVAAYKIAGVEMALGGDCSLPRDKRRGHMLLALHCMGIALGASNFDIVAEPAWAAQCYLELFVLSICVEAEDHAWAAVERFTDLVADAVPIDQQWRHVLLAVEENDQEELWRISHRRQYSRQLAIQSRDVFIAAHEQGTTLWRRAQSFRARFAVEYVAQHLEPLRQKAQGVEFKGAVFPKMDPDFDKD